MSAKTIVEGVTWQCQCGKWNNNNRDECWSCHLPKVAGRIKRSEAIKETFGLVYGPVTEEKPKRRQSQGRPIKIDKVEKPKRKPGRPKGSKNKPKEKVK